MYIFLNVGLLVYPPGVYAQTKPLTPSCVCASAQLCLMVVALAQASWTNASKKQREKLLELIRRLAEDDKDGVMAHKVLNLLWNLAHSDDVPVDIMDQALSAHIKILDYSCSQVRAGRVSWLGFCVRVTPPHVVVLVVFGCRTETPRRSSG